MPTQTLTVNVPDSLYGRLERRAMNAQRPVEEEMLEILAAAAPTDDELATDLDSDTAALDTLDDADLWRAASARLPEEAAARLEALHRQSQREGLTAADSQELSELVRLYERTMLVRARSAELLKRRGHDCSSLLASS